MDCVCVATSNLNQWALDFDGNEARIRKSIEYVAARAPTRAHADAR